MMILWLSVGCRVRRTEGCWETAEIRQRLGQWIAELAIGCILLPPCAEDGAPRIKYNFILSHYGRTISSSVGGVF